MKKKPYVFFLVLFSCLFLYGQTSSDKEEFMSEIFQSFYDSIDMMVDDYSSISGFYTTGGQVKGAASIGSNPSFRIGLTTGIIYLTNPLRFLKEIDFSNNTWNTIRKESEFKTYKPYFSWFDSYFLPLPMTRINFDVGLPKGFSIGGHFHVMPVGTIMGSINEPAINDATIWAGGGLNFTYTFIKEHNRLPSISSGFETSFSYVGIDVHEIPLGTIYLDADNRAIPATLDFITKNYTVAFAVDFSISKRIRFFQPFVNLKFVQSVYYNETSFEIALDTTSATSSAQQLYDTDFTVSNVRNTDYFNNKYGDIRAVTDFVFSTGFEFVFDIFRIGLECSFSAATQKVMTTGSLRFQLEKKDFKKYKKSPDSSRDSEDEEIENTEEEAAPVEKEETIETDSSDSTESSTVEVETEKNPGSESSETVEETEQPEEEVRDETEISEENE